MKVDNIDEVYQELDHQPPSHLTGRIEVKTPDGRTVVVKEK
jgi:hypothetical protein